jgi:hypothetical protein
MTEITHRCAPDTECFCMYDPECNPDAVSVRMIAAEITDGMVERAAISLRNFEAYDRSGVEPIDSLDNLLEPDYYRNQARAALTAALGQEQT